MKQFLQLTGLLSFLLFSQALKAQTSITLEAINANNATGYVGANNVNHSGDMLKLENGGNNGYLTFDLSVLPLGAEISGATLIFTQSATTVGIGVSNNPPTGTLTGTGKNSTLSEVLYEDIKNGPVFATNVPWDGAPGPKNVTFLNAGLLAIQNKVGATIGIGLKSPNTGIANYAKIGGYNSSDVTADPPTLTITYSIGTPQKPSTDFYASKTKFRIGDSIQFFDNSGFSPSSWLWEFGDGSTSTLKNPWKLYDSIGSYSVKLTATNAAGSKDTTFNNYITVRPLNVAPLAVNDTVYTDVNAEVEIYFAENDVENDGDLDYFSLKMDSAMMPQNGTVTYDTTGQFFLYAPNLDFNGLDSFKYIISDNDSAYSNVGVVYITVGDDSTGLSVFNERILSGLSVYPNPAQEYVFLKSSQGSIQSIELRDIAGKLVYASSIKAKETKVNVSMLNSGLYFMNCRIEGQNYSLKLIKK